DALKIAPYRELLDRHGKELDARARSAAGDLAALETLAFLQVKNRETAALQASDELGWRRYRAAKFAQSRVVGQLFADDEAAKVRGRALLKEALSDLPGASWFHRISFEQQQVAPQERERALIAWILAEYEGFSGGPPAMGPLAYT